MSTRDRVLFLAVGKTGSTSIWRYLKERHAAKIVGGYHGNDVPERYRDFFTFATVRNPYSRMVSLYRYVTVKKSNYMHRIDALLRQETLQEDFTRLPFVRPPTSLGRYRSAKQPAGSWKDLYDRQNASVVALWASKDFTA